MDEFADWFSSDYGSDYTPMSADGGDYSLEPQGSNNDGNDYFQLMKVYDESPVNNAVSSSYGTDFSKMLSTVGKSIFGGMNTGNLVSGLLVGGAQAALQSRQYDKQREDAAKLRDEDLAEYKRRHTIPTGIAVGQAAGFTGTRQGGA